VVVMCRLVACCACCAWEEAEEVEEESCAIKGCVPCLVLATCCLLSLSWRHLQLFSRRPHWLHMACRDALLVTPSHSRSTLQRLSLWRSTSCH
jgi:hypothetical protein